MDRGGLLRRQAPRRVVVLRALQLGDLLCAVPALRALRAALPAAELTLVGLPWARWLVDRFDAYLDHFVEFPGFPGLPEREPRLANIPPFLAALQRQRFDLAIQLHGNGRLTNSLVALFGAARSAGFYAADGYRPDPELFMPYPEHGSEIRRLLALVEFLGARSRGEQLEFPLVELDRLEVEGLDEAGQLPPGGYVCVHPGGRGPARRWPPAQFARVAQHLARRGYPVVVTGTAAERPLVDELLSACPLPLLDLSGRTGLGGIGALLASARLLVSNDTGVSHIAAALGTPSVIVSVGSDPERWAPHDRQRHRLVVPTGAEAEDLAAVLAEVDRALELRGSGV